MDPIAPSSITGKKAGAANAETFKDLSPVALAAVIRPWLP